MQFRFVRLNPTLSLSLSLSLFLSGVYLWKSNAKLNENENQNENGLTEIGYMESMCALKRNANGKKGDMQLNENGCDRRNSNTKK